MQVLFIDDQPEIRCEAARSFFGGCELTHMMEIPGSFEGYDIISFDNDLGTDVDVVTEIHRRLWGQSDTKDAVQGQEFIDQISDKQIVIHSMNPIASLELYNKFKSAGINASIVPFSIMLLGKKN